MTQQPSASELISHYLVDLYGGDPFEHVREASERHRREHGESLAGGEQECGVYPGGPVRMRMMAWLVRATGARRILEIGCGYGYSALWLAEAAGAGVLVDTIDRFPEHIAAARLFAQAAGLSERIDFIAGEGADALPRLSGPYDFVHDDGWFGAEPPYLERMLAVTRPGGILLLSNWFLLVESLSGASSTDWADFAGPDWRENVQKYARKLASHPALVVAWVVEPGVALLWKRPT